MSIVGHGIDLVENARIGRMIDLHGDRFLERCFTPEERSYCREGGRLHIERFAVRFAAKEAVLKALGTGWRNGIAWTDVQITRQPSGCPAVQLSGKAASIAADLGIDEWHLSLSHTEQMSMASAIALRAAC